MKQYIDLTKYDERLTIALLKEVIARDKEVAEVQEKKEIASIRSNFENTYLKHIDEGSLYGRTLEVIHLRDFVRKPYQ